MQTPDDAPHHPTPGRVVRVIESPPSLGRGARVEYLVLWLPDHRLK